MNPETWKRVNRIFHQAAELSADSRERFVHAAAEDDPEVRAAVMDLLHADSEASDYLSSPALSTLDVAASLMPASPSPGDVLAGRFRIEREVGSGGMGKVFEAYDLELRVRIALKIIRPEVAEDHTSIERFRQEVRLARSISHPNICRTYDLERVAFTTSDGRTADVFCLTMEFLEGETLAQRIRSNGPIAGDEFLSIAQQIADGLDAAHRAGIIHRDIKPQNIFLVGTQDDAPRVVITDFGLARTHAPLDSSTTLSIAGPIGTLSYMAPEQIDGSPVSPATDVYAFGLVLFEMLSGHAAYPSENLLSGLARRLKDPSSNGGLSVPGAPVTWVTTIHTCLKLDPAQRFQTAGEVMVALQGRKGPKPSYTASGLTFHLRPWMAALLLLVLVTLSFAGYRYYRTEGSSNLAPGTLVYLAPVENRTGDHSLDNLTELLRTTLSQSAQMTLLDQSRAGDILQQMKKSPEGSIDAATAREVAMRSGAARVILAAATGSSSAGYHLYVDIQQPDNTPTRFRKHWTRQFAWRSSAATNIPADLLTAVRDAGSWIRQKTGESANDIARLDAPPEDVTTDNWQALAHFSQAQAFAQHSQHEQAIAALQDAVALDPNFALAYARMGDILLSINRATEGYQAYDKALGSAVQERLTLRERNRIKGYYAMDTWNYQGAVAAFRDYLLYYPSDAAAQAYYGYALFETGQTEQAIAALKQSYALDPSRSATLEHLANYTLYLGDINESRHWNGLLSKTNPDLAMLTLGSQYFYLRHYDDAKAIFTSMLSSSHWVMRSAGYAQLTRLAADRDNWQAASPYIEGSIREARANDNKAREAIGYLDRASVNCHTANFTACNQDIALALHTDTSPWLLLRCVDLLNIAIPTASGTGRAQLLHRLEDIQAVLPTGDTVLSQILRLRLKAELLLAHGEAIQAFAIFQQADALTPPVRNHMAFAHTALIASEHASSNSDSAAYLLRAKQLLLIDLQPPGTHWQNSFSDPPGLLADSIRLYHTVIMRLHEQPDSAVQEMAEALQTVPGSSPKFNPKSTLPKPQGEHHGTHRSRV